MTDMNRFIAEKVMGVCWHEWEQTSACSMEWACKKCDQRFFGSRNEHVSPDTNPDYSTGKDKADLMDKCVGEEWWGEFKGWLLNEMHIRGEYRVTGSRDFTAYLWRNLPELVAEYRGYKCP